MATPKGGYRNKAGDRIPGVTTILGRFKESGALMWWANRLAYEPLMKSRSLMRGLRLDPGLEARIPLYVEVDKFLALPDESFDHQKAAGKAADAGTIAHGMVETYLLGGEPEKIPEYLAAEKDVRDKADNAYLAFLNWATQSNLKVEQTELGLISERHGFGGTMDGNIVTLNGKLAIADWKTSNGIYSDYLLQVAAYGLLWKENFPDRPIEAGFEIARFSKEGGSFEHRHWDNLADAEAMFLLLVEAYKLDKKVAQLLK